MSAPIAARPAPRLLSCLLLLLSLACSDQSGGQTGSELSCSTDEVCVMELGSGFRCGSNQVCVEDGPTFLPDGGAVDDGIEGCFVKDDCTGEAADGTPEVCAGPSEPQVCGIPPSEECATDDECSESCNAIADPCSPDGVGSVCGGGCLPTDNCGEGLRCGVSGACEAIPCDEGYQCPDYQECDVNSIASATAVYDRHHGCVSINCSGSECAGEQACVNGVCQAGPGTCEFPVAVP